MMNIDMALDDIISKEKSRKRFQNDSRKGGFRGRNRRSGAGNSRSLVNSARSARRPTISTVPDKIMVTNLAKSVTQDDIRELFSSIGPIKSVQLSFDSSGKSKGIAFVVFQRPSDAQRAVKEYYNRSLDNSIMKLELVYKVNRDDYLFITKSSKDKRKPRAVSNSRGGTRRKFIKRNRAPKKTQEDLNAEIDDYMGNSESMDVVEDKCAEFGLQRQRTNQDMNKGVQQKTSPVKHTDTGINITLENALDG